MHFEHPPHLQIFFNDVLHPRTWARSRRDPCNVSVSKLSSVTWGILNARLCESTDAMGVHQTDVVKPYWSWRKERPLYPS